MELIWIKSNKVIFGVILVKKFSEISKLYISSYIFIKVSKIGAVSSSITIEFWYKFEIPSKT